MLGARLRRLRVQGGDMPVTNTAVASTYALKLAGSLCGSMRSVAGGGISAPVVEAARTPDDYPQKHIGQPTYEDFTLQFGFEMASDVYAWIESGWTPTPQRRDGSIVTADFNGNA